MHYYFRNILLHAVFLAYGSLAYAQLPNEKFGKPSNKEWEFVGWSDAVDADAVILCRTMKASYLLPNYLYILGQESPDGIPDNHPDFGNYQTKESDICVEYEFKLRTKILKPDGAKHANIDITYFDAVDDILLNTDEISDLKIMVFTKNKKGKVEKRSIRTDSFVKERVNDNYMVMHVVVPDVQAGCIIEYQYKITSFRHTFLYDWVFQERIPTVRSKCDIEIPSFLQFNMNIPINKFVKPSVKSGRILYDTSRRDLKRPKSCPTNHYIIIGDYILPYKAENRKMPIFTSQIITPNVPIPEYMPKGYTHLKIK